jgi:hypothetical protein
MQMGAPWRVGRRGRAAGVERPIDARAGGCHVSSMRSAIALAIAASLVVLILPGAVRAEDYQKLVIPVGEKFVVGGYAGMCDDPSVATISLAEYATITAVKVGTTVCSSRVNGLRQIFRVVVEAKARAK